eukprot:TRINITY_DN14610_c0_g1_i1.p1 TRINITY_DN14610_c0_g1~~TRINITY_DN14610_c0_g1_i1.p1  ORF type:complete len:317 (-),score=82.01 TRINITY_DN14610_c0_g1_i1:607-1476(-)
MAPLNNSNAELPMSVLKKYNISQDDLLEVVEGAPFDGAALPSSVCLVVELFRNVRKLKKHFPHISEEKALLRWVTALADICRDNEYSDFSDCHSLAVKARRYDARYVKMMGNREKSLNFLKADFNLPISKYHLSGARKSSSSRGTSPGGKSSSSSNKKRVTGQAKRKRTVAPSKKRKTTEDGNSDAESSLDADFDADADLDADADSFSDEPDENVATGMEEVNMKSSNKKMKLSRAWEEGGFVAPPLSEDLSFGQYHLTHLGQGPPMDLRDLENRCVDVLTSFGGFGAF